MVRIHQGLDYSCRQVIARAIKEACQNFKHAIVSIRQYPLQEPTAAMMFPMHTSSMLEMESLASLSACSTGTLQRFRRSLHMSSNLARVRLVSMCLGPSGVAVMKGRLMEVWETPESSILAFSAASVSLESDPLGRQDQQDIIAEQLFFESPFRADVLLHACMMHSSRRITHQASLADPLLTSECYSVPPPCITPLQGLAILPQINALALLEVSSQVVNNALVEVISAQVGVSAGGQHLEDAVTNLGKGRVAGEPPKTRSKPGICNQIMLFYPGQGCVALCDLTSRMETSKVPPPRSKTRMVSLALRSNP